MQITWTNYRTLLPACLWDAFFQLAQSRRAETTPIIYKDRELRFATADEL
jgi:hypothetical protein